VQETSAVLAVEDPALQEEVLHFLERIPRLRIVGATTTPSRLQRTIREQRPDVAVITPGLLASAEDLDGAALLVVGTEERVGDLRLALRAGASGFYLWPGEREALGRDAIQLRPPMPTGERPPGRVVAVYGPRGGAGTTFLATNLAAACARGGLATILVDLDLFFADVTAALGFEPNPGARTLADLAPVLDEVAPEHLDPVLRDHEAGFSTLLAPEAGEALEAIEAGQASGLVRALRARGEVIVLHLPRCIDDGVRGALESADRILVVVSLDVLAFRDARRALDLLAGLGLEARTELVINRAARSEVVPQDAQVVFGKQPLAVIRQDRAVPRAQNRGELVVGRSGPAARAVQSLARRLMAEVKA
jgi:Flp pilus assembly CpaE family ATPase